MRKILLYMLVICLSIGWIPYSAEAEEQTLHLLDFFSDENDEKVEALFHEMYPDVKVVRDYTDDPRIILHRVLSGDENVDIIMFSEGQGPSAMEAALAGALEDLNNYPSLQTVRENYLDHVQNYTLGDVWYGLPMKSCVLYWYANPALFAEMGIPLPKTDWTWDDFFALGKQVQQYNDMHGTDYYLMQELSSIYLTEQLLGVHVDYQSRSHTLDSDAFREILLRWLELIEHGVIADDYVRSLERQETFADALLTRTIVKQPGDIIRAADMVTMASLNKGGVLVIPPRSEGMEPCIETGFQACIATFSDMKEEAAYFLRCYAAVEQEQSVQNAASRDEMEECEAALKNPYFYPWMDVNMKSDAVQFPDNTVAREKVNTTVYMLNHASSRYWTPLHQEVVNNQWRSLRKGEISFEQYLQNCVSFADQYLGE